MFRTVFSKIVRNGRQIFGEILQKQAPNEAKEAIKVGLESQPKLSIVTPQVARAGEHGETVLSRYLARSVTKNLAGEMRRKFALSNKSGSWSIFGGARLQQGSRLSLYAFVGVGLAAGTQPWQRAETEGFDSVCDQIKGMFKTRGEEESDNIGHTLGDFEFGPLIAKGCNAAVYKAKLRTEVVETVKEDREAESEQKDLGEVRNEDVSNRESLPEVDDNSVSSTASEESSDINQDFKPSPGADLSLQSTASSIEVLTEDDMACVTDFDPGGTKMDLRWRFEIVPLEGDPVTPCDTGWSDEEDLDNSIEVITDREVSLDGIPFVVLERSDAGGLDLDKGNTNEQGAVLLGEWDIRLEDGVNLQESDTFPNTLPLLTLNQADPENLKMSLSEDQELENHLANIRFQDLDPENRVPVEPPIPAGLERAALDQGVEESSEYNLAIKMMFNYDAESNAPSILRTMAKELVPAKLAWVNESMSKMGNISHRWKKKDLPPHPNIVEMKGVFVDWFPHFPDAWDEYPAAMPERLNPGGCGRNQTMFLVMKRYPMTLREYLKNCTPSLKERTQLLTQLVEGIVHMNQHGVAHRDLKTDNILVEQMDSGPHLVISDFGCCTTEGLQIPFTTLEVDRGGNGSLMAPEIANATPGMFRQLDYSKSDLWAAGAIAYEIFGAHNPFYRNERGGQKLDSRTFTAKDLPSLAGSVPRRIQSLICLMLTKDPAKRPDPSLVANMLQLIQWSPNQWITEVPSRLEVKRWLLNLAAEVVCQRLKGQSSSSTEHQLKSLFLSRIDLEATVVALNQLPKLGNV